MCLLNIYIKIALRPSDGPVAKPNQDGVGGVAHVEEGPAAQLFPDSSFLLIANPVDFDAVGLKLQDHP